MSCSLDVSDVSDVDSKGTVIGQIHVDDRHRQIPEHPTLIPDRASGSMTCQSP